MTTQLSLLEQKEELTEPPEVSETSRERKNWRNIDIKTLEAELNELAGTLKVKVRLDPKLAMATSIKESDRAFLSA